MAALERPKDELVALFRFASEALDQTNNQAAAIGVLAHRLASDEEVQAEAGNAMAFLAAEAAVHTVLNRSRDAVRNASPCGKDDARGLRLMATRNLSLYDFAVPGGTRLGLSSKDAVLFGAEIYLRNARGNLSGYHWLTAIAAAMGEAEQVSDALSVERLAEFREKAEEKVDRAAAKTKEKTA